MLSRTIAAFPSAPYTALHYAPIEAVHHIVRPRVVPSHFSAPASSFEVTIRPANYVWDGLRSNQKQLFATPSPAQGNAVRSVSHSPRAAVATEMVEVLVKGAIGAPDKLGDCPFSQRVLLTLEEKGVKYHAKNIDTQNKPQWFLDANPEGKVPVLKLSDGSYMADSDAIVDRLEQQYPEPSLITPEDKKSVGSKVFPSFVKSLKSQDPNDGSEQALLDELKALEEALKASGGPYIAGSKVTAADLSLAPKLHHLHVALKHFKDWEVPKDLQHVHNYIQALENRDSFKHTKPATEYVIAGWEAHAVPTRH